MKRGSKTITAADAQNDQPPVDGLLVDIRSTIEHARQQASVAVNVAQTHMYWRIGQRIHAELLHSERAPYGVQIVATVSRQLVQEYGRGSTPRVAMAGRRGRHEIRRV